MRIPFYLLFISPLWGCSQNTLPVYSDKDSDIVVQVGDTFAIELPSNIGTGYRWELEQIPDSSLLSLAKQEHHPGPNPDDNAGGHDYFMFETHNKGTLQLGFWYVRPWKKEEAPDKQRSFTIIVN
jgi:predicted secreted protein